MSDPSLACRVDAFFAADGALARAMPGYEGRPEQRAFAQRVAIALETGQPLLAEAGTGIGKTLGYLVPAVLSGKKTLISTATRALQAQILRDDVPTLERALGTAVGVVTLKGRLNYLCERRAEAILVGGSVDPATQARLASLAAWRRTTQTGDKSEWSDADKETELLWRRVTASSDQCLGRRCTHYERCWVVRNRKRAEEAPLTITNHHLFFADAALRERQAPDGDAPVSLLPKVERTLFDEAHELDDIAALHFGAQASDSHLQQLLAEVGGLADEAHDVRAHGMVVQALQAIDEAFAQLPMASTGAAFVDLDTQTSSQIAASQACERMVLLAGYLEDGDGKLAKSSEARFFARRLQVAATQMAAAFAVVPDAQGARMVRWCHAQGDERHVQARPIDVAAPLHKALGRTPGIFVSATLRVAGEFVHAKRRLGLEGADELCVESPYDWASHAHLYLPDHLPSPQLPTFAAQAGALAASLVVASGGGAFVLCTSHQALRGMRDAIARVFDGLVLVQGEGNKEALLAQFAAHGHAVLVATLTFWRGVDVPGLALRLVIMDRIPFSPPTDPYVEARMQHAKSLGGDGFRDVQLPQAALLLRQGAGRLLRGSQDRGLVAILDPRLRRKGYGKKLIATLPGATQVTDHAQALQHLQALRRQAESRQPSGRLQPEVERSKV